MSSKHEPFTDDGVTYCGWDGHEGCGELWPCSAATEPPTSEQQKCPRCSGTRLTRWGDTIGPCPECASIFLVEVDMAGRHVWAESLPSRLGGSADVETYKPVEAYNDRITDLDYAIDREAQARQAAEAEVERWKDAGQKAVAEIDLLHDRLASERAYIARMTAAWDAAMDRAEQAEVDLAEAKAKAAGQEIVIRSDERSRAYDRMESVAELLSDHPRFHFTIHPDEFCEAGGVEHSACTVYHYLLEAARDPEYPEMVRAAHERVGAGSPRCPRCRDQGFYCDPGDDVITCPGELCSECDYRAGDLEATEESV